MVKINKKIIIFTLISIILGSPLISAGFWDWFNQITGRAADEYRKCYYDEDCADLICMDMIGQDMPKCNPSTGECYCDGDCGDGYCDSYEREYGTCPYDCQLEICSDGTEYGKCSSTKPKYCTSGPTEDYILIDKCWYCGCPSNRLCQDDGTCLTCTDQYDPVCGIDGKTYLNDCYAYIAGIAIDCEGECACEACDTSDREGDKYCGTDNQWHTQKQANSQCNANYECVSNNCENDKCQIMCYDLSDPVCGIDGKTYLNDCYAYIAGVAIACEGACPCTKKCYDGTEYGKCSETQPLYCEGGVLINKCSFCGCPYDKTCQEDGSCATPIQECYDGTPYGQCSINRPKYCDEGDLIDNCNECGCPSGEICFPGGSCEQGGYSESFEKGLGGWTPNHYLECEHHDPPCWPLDWSISRSDRHSFDGVYSLEAYLNGDHDDGTIWVQKQFNVDPEASNIVLTFNFRDVFDPAITWPIVAYIGTEPPEREEDFQIIGYTGQVEGWKQLSLSRNLYGVEKIWIAFGYGATWEAPRTFYMDFVNIFGVEEQEEAYFKFDYPPRPETFIFKLTDSRKIQEARDILAGRQTDAIHVMGYIKRGAVSYNPPYDYHLDPDSISFFEYAMELCDAAIFESYPIGYCSQYPPGQCTWCPWGSRLIREVGAPEMEIEGIECDNGCLDENNNCLPFGIRTSTQYCDIDKTLKNQLLEGSSCNNNFECETNFCLEGICTEQGFFIKMMDWFNEIFG